MALPPRSLGARVRPVRVERAGEGRYGVRVGERALPRVFGSEGEARCAAAAEAERLDAVGLALARRVRSRSMRKR